MFPLELVVCACCRFALLFLACCCLFISLLLRLFIAVRLFARFCKLLLLSSYVSNVMWFPLFSAGTLVDVSAVVEVQTKTLK